MSEFGWALLGYSLGCLTVLVMIPLLHLLF
jgi:hypothetical protein